MHRNDRLMIAAIYAMQAVTLFMVLYMVLYR